MKKHNYDIWFLHLGMGPSIITTTDHNAKQAAKKILREINRANSPGYLVRRDVGSPEVTIATFKCEEDL